MLNLLLAFAVVALAPDDSKSVVAAPSPATIKVSVNVDFGIARKEPIRREVELPGGSTVVDATRAVAAVEQDRVCCSPVDVWSIDGVGPDVRRHAYWYWRLAGEPGPELPARFALKDGDVVGWSFGGRAPERSGKHRVVSLLPAATEILLALGADDDVVAISHLCPAPAGAERPRVVSTTVDSEHLSMREIDAAVRAASAKRESLYTIDEERIRALQPTEVLSQGLCPVCAVPQEQADALEKSGACAKLVVLTPRTLADVAADIRRVGKAIDCERDADIVARDFERRIAKVRTAAKSTERPRVAVIEWFDPLWVSGEWIAEMVEAGGGTPVLAGAAAPSRRIEWTDLASADPDVIVLAPCSMTVARAERELDALKSHAEWSAMRAVKDGRVFLMNGAAHFSSPGPGLARGAELLGAILADPDHAHAASAEDWKRITK